jgi:hypothetical protein
MCADGREMGEEAPWVPVLSDRDLEYSTRVRRGESEEWVVRGRVRLKLDRKRRTGEVVEAARRRTDIEREG